MRQKLIDIPDRRRHFGVGIRANSLHGVGRIVQRCGNIFGRRDGGIRERYVIRRRCILLQGAFQLGQLRRGRLIELGVVDGDSRNLLQTVIKGILLCGVRYRLDDIVEQTGAGGPLNTTDIDTAARLGNDQSILAGVAVLMQAGDVARDDGRLDARRHKRRAGRIECDRK